MQNKCFTFVSINKADMNIKIFTLFFILCLNTSLSAQLKFTNQSDTYFPGKPGYSGSPIAIADVNQDGLDDIVRINKGTLEVLYQQLDGSAFKVVSYQKLPGDIFALAAANLDNDRELEIIFGNVGAVYVIQLLPTYSIQQVATGVFTQSISIADINGDRKNDIFIANDVNDNLLLMNKGNGLMVRDTTRFPPKFTEKENLRGNYGTVFSDVDLDGDIDMYVTKCIPNGGPTHPGRINILYLNNGTGHFTIAPESVGLNSTDQGWSTDFGDYDQDGDFDAVIVNHDGDNKLYRNDHGVFRDMSDSIDLGSSATALQVKWVDLNNDSWPDILIGGEEHVVIMNNGNGTFTKANNPFGLNNMLSYGLGDLNRDGKVDIYASYGSNITVPSDIPDRLFINNTPNPGHFYGLRILDSLHNEAIGAKAILYTNRAAYLQEIKVGDAYGICNSSQLIYHFGANEHIDSLKIMWLSGKKRTLTQKKDFERKFLVPDLFYTFAEDECQSPQIVFTVQDDKYQFCDGDSVIVKLTGDGNYFFTTDSASHIDTKIIKETTLIGAVASNGECKTWTPLYLIEKDPTQTVSLEYFKQQSYCKGDSVTFTTDSPLDILSWQDGSNQDIYHATADGPVYAKVKGLCNDIYSDTVSLTFTVSPAPVAVHDTIAKDSSATLYAIGDSIWWYKSPDQLIPDQIGGAYHTGPLTINDTLFARNLLIQGITSLLTGLPIDSSASAYGSADLNGGLYFDTYQDIILHSVNVETHTAGKRKFVVVDEVGNLISSADVDLVTGKQTVNLEMSIPKGNDFILTTDEKVNLQSLGVNGPFLTRDRDKAHFENYKIPDLLNIKGSSLGTRYYFYFYDWNVGTPLSNCLSDAVPVIAYQKDGLSLKNLNARVFPVTYTGSTFEFSAPLTGDVDIRLMHISGKVISQQTINLMKGQESTLQAKDLIPGIYLIQLTDGKQNYVAKVAVPK